MFTSLLLATLSLTPTAEVPQADEAIHRYLKGEVNRLSGHFLDDAKNLAEWEAKRPKLREQLFEMLGLSPMPDKTPLKATNTSTITRSNVTIENVHFQSKPGLYVTGNLYRPKDSTAKSKLPAILYVCGHSNRGRDGNKTAFQDHGLWFASNGYVCLVVDTLQLGEVAGKHHGTYNLNRFWWQDRGYTSAGVECWNGIRAIDYLCSRPEVNPEQIGVTGISGGGATTVWVAATDERVKVAVPVSGMSDLESYVGNKVINGHCDCMFYINTYQWEWTTALALHAPKPLLFANSDNDPIFPMDGNRRIISRLQQCYGLFGKKDLAQEYVSIGGHDYRPDLRLAIFGFFHKHLKKDSTPIKDADFPKIDGKELRVFPEDKDLPKDQINDRIDELFVPLANIKLPTSQADVVLWKANLLKDLRAKSFRSLPEKPETTIEWNKLTESPARLSSEINSQFYGMKIHSALKSKSEPSTLLVLNSDENSNKIFEDVQKHLSKNSDFFAVIPRGGSDLKWTQKNPPNTVERSLALLGQTVDTGRVRDVISMLSAASKNNVKLRLVGNRQAGVIALYAALFAPENVAEVVLIDPPTSHRDGPHFLNVDRVIDLPTALGLLAPSIKLTLINAGDKAFDQTSAIYKLAGAESKLDRRK